jgi:hypothetical protein
MYSPESPVYIQTDNIRKGIQRLLPHDEKMVERISASSGIKALNFYCDTVETSKGYKLQHVVIIVQSIQDEKNMPGKSFYESFVSWFHDYFDEYGPSASDPSKQKIFPRINGIYPDINVGYTCMERIDLQIAYTNANDELNTITIPYQDEVWHVSMNGNNRTIFYYTEEQLKKNSSNGINDALRAQMLAILKKYDTYQCFGEHSLMIYFDSKESFDRDYDGKWHYYYK